MIFFNIIHLLKKEIKIKSLTLVYGFGVTPFGNCLLALLEEKIYYLSFVVATKKDSLRELFQTWPEASFLEDNGIIAPIIKSIFGENKNSSFSLFIKGTPLQVGVWRKALKIPLGTTITYQALASALGNPKAYRAVARVLSQNRIAYLIPCHRVLAKTGRMQGYRWGIEKKKKILDWEASQKDRLVD